MGRQKRLDKLLCKKNAPQEDLSSAYSYAFEGWHEVTQKEFSRWSRRVEDRVEAFIMQEWHDAGRRGGVMVLLRAILCVVTCHNAVTADEILQWYC